MTVTSFGRFRSGGTKVELRSGDQNFRKRLYLARSSLAVRISYCRRRTRKSWKFDSRAVAAGAVSPVSTGPLFTSLVAWPGVANLRICSADAHAKSPEAHRHSGHIRSYPSGTCEISESRQSTSVYEQREDLVMPEEEDLIERACTYLLEHRYPDLRSE